MMISFVIPVYNCAAYLPVCVQSLVTINSADYEILLIDDGSMDESGVLCDQLAAQDSRIRTVHQSNQGVSAARNRGIVEARGDYISFIDADDTINSQLFTDLLKESVQADNPDMVAYGMSFDYYRHGQNYRSSQCVCSVSGRMEPSQWLPRVEQLFHCNYLSPVWNKLFRRQFLLDHGLRFRPDMFLYEDLDFSIRCLAFCGPFYCSDQVVYRYRQPEDEGNAGRRLKRVPVISDAVAQIREAFLLLAEQKQLDRRIYDGILCEIFCTLAREKIAVSGRSTIRDICTDYSCWIQDKRIPADLLDAPFSEDLLHTNLYSLIKRRTYTAIRHSIANEVKYWRFLRRKES